MSGWDASSRPAWDPQGGTGENTQASYGVPDFPDGGGGFPSSESPGTPPAIFLQDYDQNDYPGQDSPWQETRWQDDPRQHSPRQQSPRQEEPWHDTPRQHSPRQDDPPVTDRRDPNDQPDADYAARRDPALRDFFGPPSARDDRATQANGYRRANGAGHAPPYPPDRGAAAPRPGSRTARRQEIRDAARGNRPTASIVIAVVIVAAIAVAAFLVLRHHNPGTPAASGGGSTPAPTLSTPARQSPSANGTPSSGTAAGYTLSTPAVAGGYAKLTSEPAAVRTAAGGTATAIRDAAVKDHGGTVTSHVSAAYQLSGGQVLTFTGFRGTFSPAKVMASLATFGTNSHVAAAGPDGGKLDCVTAHGTSNGTVCVWVTTTTLGITEFFSPQGPEVVTDQAKAAADTLKFRDSVEARES